MNGGRFPSRLAVVVLGVIALPLVGCVPFHHAPRAPAASRAPDPPTAHRDLILAETMARGAGPLWVELDSGVVYRFVSNAAHLFPYQLGRQPPFVTSRGARAGGDGVFLIPAFTGRYRIDPDPNADGDVIVRLYRERMDGVEWDCARDARGFDCVAQRGGRHRLIRYVLMTAWIPIAFFFWNAGN